MDMIQSLRDKLEAGVGPTQQMTECLCGKLTPANAAFAYSGVVNYASRLCSSCADTYKTASRIVCLRCKSLQGFMQANRTKDGFMFAEGKCYHIDGCPRCVEGRFSTPVLEYKIHLKQKGIQCKDDLDLLQHIEIKKLQVGEEAVKLSREAIKSFQDDS